MSYYTKEQIEWARSVDLLTYLQTYEPTELVHIRGDTYCSREHDSLKISNGKWYWWSRGFGASSALDYLIKVQGMKFTDAMKILTDGAKAPSFLSKMESDSGIVENKRLLLPERSETTREITRYLSGRGIDRNLIEACIHREVLFESLPYHNCVFIGHDEKGIVRYGCYRSTNDLTGSCSGCRGATQRRLSMSTTCTRHTRKAQILGILRARWPICTRRQRMHRGLQR